MDNISRFDDREYTIFRFAESGCLLMEYIDISNGFVFPLIINIASNHLSRAVKDSDCASIPKEHIDKN